MNIQILKEQISKMSTQELVEKIEQYRNKLAYMIAIGSDEIETLALYQAELNSRKENGNS